MFSKGLQEITQVITKAQGRASRPPVGVLPAHPPDPYECLEISAGLIKKFRPYFGTRPLRESGAATGEKRRNLGT